MKWSMSGSALLHDVMPCELVAHAVRPKPRWSYAKTEMPREASRLNAQS